MSHPNRSKQQQAKHTPGPWQITAHEDFPHDAITAHGGETLIAEMMADGQTGLEVMANARLIAAAPELLAALQTVMHNWRCGVPMDDRTPTGYMVAAAIAKAEGR